MFERADGGRQWMDDVLVAEVESDEDRGHDVAESTSEDDVVPVQTERDHPVSRQALHAATNLHSQTSVQVIRLEPHRRPPYIQLCI